MIAVLDIVSYWYPSSRDGFTRIIDEVTTVCQKWITAQIEMVSLTKFESDEDKDEVDQNSNTKIITFHSYIVCFQSIVINGAGRQEEIPQSNIAEFILNKIQICERLKLPARNITAYLSDLVEDSSKRAVSRIVCYLKNTENFFIMDTVFNGVINRMGLIKEEEMISNSWKNPTFSHSLEHRSSCFISESALIEIDILTGKILIGSVIPLFDFLM